MRVRTCDRCRRVVEYQAERFLRLLLTPHPSEELVLYLPPARREEER